MLVIRKVVISFKDSIKVLETIIVKETEKEILEYVDEYNKEHIDISRIHILVFPELQLTSYAKVWSGFKKKKVKLTGKKYKNGQF